MARHAYATNGIFGVSLLALASGIGAMPAYAQVAGGSPVGGEPVVAQPVPTAPGSGSPTAPAANTTAPEGIATTTDSEGDIIVTGARAAERAAVEMKRTSLSVTETIVADDVGKLPDQNVAESVRRLPGLSVANDQGEGRYVVIRGVNPNLVNVTVNGQTQPAPEPDGRQVKLDDIPSALIAAVTISKSLTADLDANAIGGSVDIRTLSAFDRKQNLFVTARGDYGWYKLGHGKPFSVDGQVGGRFGPDHQFGFILSASYSERPIESEQFTGTTNYRAPVAANGFIVPDTRALRDYSLTRKRTGFVANFDWQPSDAVRLFIRGTYSRFGDRETRDQNLIDNQSAFTSQTATSGTFRGRGSILVREREENSNTKVVSGGGTFEIGEGKLDLTGAWARAQKKDPLRSEYNFRTGGTALTVTYDLTSPLYSFTPDAVFANPANFGFNSVNYDKRLAQEELKQARADFRHPIGIGSDSEIKLGVKYLDRQKTNNRDFIAYTLTAGRTFTLANAGGFTSKSSIFEGRFPFGLRVDYDAAQAFVAANPGLLTVNATSTRNNSLVNDYDVNERIAAGYVMATLSFGDLTLIPGVRVEHTRDKARAKLITATSTVDSPFNSFGETSYTDIFPGVNAKYNITDRLVARAAVTTSIGRPNYPDLAPFVSVDTTTTPTSVTMGNAGISPYKAVNYDAALEFYLPHAGIVAVGVFAKTIDDPIYTQTILTTNGTFAGQTFALANVTQPVNASKAVIHGIEFNFQTEFSFLPSPLDGLGLSANFTLVGGHGRGLPNRSGDFPLFFQSKRVGSVQLSYEKYGISARVAYSYRSKYLDALGTSAATDQYTDQNGQVDVRVGYDITKNINVFGQATNLNDAPFRRFIGNRNQILLQERYDYSVRGGVQLKF